jgi:hypothetical protein
MKAATSVPAYAHALRLGRVAVGFTALRPWCHVGLLGASLWSDAAVLAPASAAHKQALYPLIA